MRKDTSPQETFYGHRRTPSNNGGMTVAWRADVNSNVLVYSVARCSTKDNFCKKIGRDIASGRLTAHKATIMTRDHGLKLSEMTPGQVTELVLNHAQSGIYSGR